MLKCGLRYVNNVSTSKYKIIEQYSQVFYISRPEYITFKSNADFEKFYEVRVDGNTIDSTNYTTKDGTTIVTLKQSYLKELSVGEHILQIVSMDGFAQSKFTVD